MDLSEKIDLYRNYETSFHNYVRIIWQFPAAIITINIIALGQIGDRPELLIGLALLNYALLFGVFRRHVINQNSLSETLRNFEREIFVDDEELRPNFKSPTIKATFAIQLALFIANTALFVFAASLIPSNSPLQYSFPMPF